MQLINQIYLSLLSIILLAIFSSSIYKLKIDTNQPGQALWPASILCRVVAFLAWVMSPYLGVVALEVANATFVASSITLVLFIRSWRVEITKNLKLGLFVLWILFCIGFAWLLALPQSLPQRFMYTSAVILLFSCWECYETSWSVRNDKSYLLKVLVVTIVIQLVLAFSAVGRSMLSSVLNTSSIMQTDINSSAMIFMWLTFGVHLVTYIIINSYLYEQMWQKALAAKRRLLEKQLELKETTEEKAQIEQLLKERDQLIAGLVRANKTASTGAMAASIAHEMAQPLAVIQMNSEFLDKLSQGGALNPKVVHDMLSGIINSNHHAANIIQTLRGIFLDNPPVFERTNINQLVNSVVQLARTNLDKNGIRLILEIPDDIEADLYRNELFQVLLNLINNATNILKSQTTAGGEIGICALVHDDDLFIKVKDNGPGVSPEMQDKLFKLFAHEGASESMGLGLWLCSYIIQRHQGGIWQENDPAGGAQFFIRLPLVQPAIS